MDTANRAAVSDGGPQGRKATAAWLLGSVLLIAFGGCAGRGGAGVSRTWVGDAVREAPVRARILTRPTELRSTGAVSLAFDDGWASEFEAYRIASRSGLRGTIYYVTDHLGDRRFLSAEQLRIMAEDGWEIGSHTVSHPRLTQISPARMARELRESRSILARLGFTVTTVAYPNGDHNRAVSALAARYYVASRTTRWLKLNDLPPSFGLSSRSVDNSVPFEEVRRWIDEARERRKWLILTFHEIRPSKDAASYHTSVTYFRRIIDYLVETEVPTPTIAEVVARYPPIGP